MDKSFMNIASLKLAEYLGCEQEDIYVVWMSKTLQNIKGMFSSGVPAAKGMYYELTYNGDKKELYIDSYKKQKNECIKVEL